MSGYWKMILFRQLRVTPIFVDHETDCVEKLISLAFHIYKEHPNRMLYAYYVSILRQGGHGLRIRKKHGK
jgi:hypothetical protein